MALVKMHDPTLPAIAARWGLTSSARRVLRLHSGTLLKWLAETGATKIAVHFDVDTIDADEIQLGQGADRGGLTSVQDSPGVADIHGATEVGALIAEYTHAR